MAVPRQAVGEILGDVRRRVDEAVPKGDAAVAPVLGPLLRVLFAVLRLIALRPPSRRAVLSAVGRVVA